MTIEIRVYTDEDEAAMLAAHRENKIDLDGMDYVIRHGHRTIAGRTQATVIHSAGPAGIASRGGAGGSSGTNSVVSDREG